MAELEEGQNVLCTVDKISGTTVFVKIVDDGEGNIVTSEIAPGRIRNLRDYVVPGKKIVCKILEIENNNIHLSLRRVTEKERKEVLDRYEKEKNCLSILKSVVKNPDETALNIKKKQGSLNDFFQNCKTSPEELEKFMNKEEASRICQILQDKKEKQIEIKKEFRLKSELPNGISIIKKILLPYKDKIIYLAAGRFSIKTYSEDSKKANQEMIKILNEIETYAKKENCKFEAR